LRYKFTIRPGTPGKAFTGIQKRTLSATDSGHPGRPKNRKLSSPGPSVWNDFGVFNTQKIQNLQHMGPTTSELIKKEIIDQLTWDSSVNANDVYVTVTDGVAELRGKVSTYASKIAAEKNACSVEGVDVLRTTLKSSFPPIFPGRPIRKLPVQ
jgi:hypothetical protein